MIAASRARGVDMVVRPHRRRAADFRCGHRWGRGDHVVLWTKPEAIPAWMSREEYDAMPERLPIREVRVSVEDKTERVRRLVIVTTLLDVRTYPAMETGGLFRQ